MFRSIDPLGKEGTVDKRVPLIIFLLTLLLSVALSPWWDPWNYSLSSLGSSSNGLGGAIFNYGVSLTGVSLQDTKNELLSLIGLTAIAVGAINIDFGIYHYIPSLLLFVLLLTYILLKGRVGLLILSLTAWYLHFLYSFPPGIAIPELITIVSAFVAMNTS